MRRGRPNHVEGVSVAGGFTLIELLIVVAIIAILAAIAVPNFLEAQVRAKASRASSDLRTIATALEAYAVDFNRYPPNPDPDVSFYVTPVLLTTPMAYLASRPNDPFKAYRNVASRISTVYAQEEEYYAYYTILSWSEYMIASEAHEVFLIAIDTPLNQGARHKYGKWLQWSIGPDAMPWLDDVTATSLKQPPGHPPWGYSFDVPYNSTNGTKSFGNIIHTHARAEGSRPFIE